MNNPAEIVFFIIEIGEKMNTFLTLKKILWSGLINVVTMKIVKLWRGGRKFYRITTG